MIEAHCRQGVGQEVLSYIQQRLRKEGCQYIQIWVDEGRDLARALYLRTRFEEREVIPHYYAPGGIGIKMVLDLET